MRPFELDRYLEWEAPPLLVAEAGVNHGGDLDTAREMVRAGAAAGVDAIKFQTYRAERLATRTSEAYWDRTQEATPTQFELFSKYDRLTPDDYRALAEEAHAAGILFLTTPFDVDSIDWLDDLLPAYKVASADVTNVPLLRRIAATRKPVFLSTGAATIEEIEDAVAVLGAEGCPGVALLHCTLAYPTPAADANLGALHHLQTVFPDTVLGYSDHTVPEDSYRAIESAFVLGARVIEKHFTLDRTLPGNDHYHAFEPQDFERLIDELERVRILLGSRRKVVLDAELPARVHARRSLVTRVDVPRGTVVSAEMLDVKRPGTGIEPRHLETVVGRRAACDIAEDSTLQWDMLSEPESP